MSRRPAATPSRGSSRAAQESARLAAEQAVRRRRDRNLLLVAVVALVVIVVGGGIGVQAYRTKRAPAAAPAVAFSEAPQPVRDGQPLRFGEEGAPVKVTLYEDFHCPHCADFETELGPTLTSAVTAGTTGMEVYPMSSSTPAPPRPPTPSPAPPRRASVCGTTWACSPTTPCSGATPSSSTWPAWWVAPRPRPSPAASPPGRRQDG